MNGYKLKEISISNKEHFEVFIKADSNDADYISTETILTKEEFEKVALDQLRVLEHFYSSPHTFHCFYSDTVDLPTGDWGDCHSLVELRVRYFNEDGKAYMVELEPFTKEELKFLNEEYNGDIGQYLEDLEGNISR